MQVFLYVASWFPEFAEERMLILRRLFIFEDAGTDFF